MEQQEISKYEQALAVGRNADITINQYRFKGLGVHDSECKVEVWLSHSRAVVLFTDKGIGTSVTNASEQLVTGIYNQYLQRYSKDTCLFMETYDRREAVDIIIPNWVGNKVEGVDWVHLGKVK